MYFLSIMKCLIKRVKEKWMKVMKSERNGSERRNYLIHCIRHWGIIFNLYLKWLCEKRSLWKSHTLMDFLEIHLWNVSSLNFNF